MSQTLTIKPEPADRVAEQRGGVHLPPGTVVVSADNHWSLSEDIFVERAPAHLKAKMPRVFMHESGFVDWIVDGKTVLLPIIQDLLRAFERVPGCAEMGPRLDDMTTEGIDKEIVFGNGGISVYHSWPDLEVREWVYRIYNQHLHEKQQLAPGRFYGVGLVNYWDHDKTSDSLAELDSLGLKTLLLPQNPKGADGTPLDYCDPTMEPLWQAVEDAALPICFHVGEFFQSGPGGTGRTSMVNFGPFRKTFGELVFGGILDRHPTLKIIFAEGDINWIPGALQTAEMIYQSYNFMLAPKLAHEPRHYWHNNMYATFMHDPVGLRLLDLIGADRVMWSNDYPHPESVYGEGWQSIQAVLDNTTPRQAKQILGHTALDLFNLH